MKIEFITHGLSSTIKTVSDYLNESFSDKDFNEFYGVSAFTRKSGINKFKKALLRNKHRFSIIQFTLGIVPRGTTIEALEFFLENDINCYTYFNASNMLHSKIYYFKGLRFSRFIIGSSNLTAAGLNNNIESSVIIEFKSGDPKGNKFIRDYKKHFNDIAKKDTDFVNLNSKLLEQLIEDQIIFSESPSSSFEEHDGKTAKRIRKSRKKYIKRIDIEPALINTKFNNTTASNKTNPLSNNYLNKWPSYLKIYKQYIIDTNRTVVSKHTRISGLIGWYFKQKRLYREGILPKEHYRILQKLNFPFEDAHKLTYDKAFYARVDEFKNYVIKFGTNQIPRTRDRSNPYKSLSDWVALTRSDFNLGKVSEERIQALKNVNFPFNAKTKGRQKEDDVWMEKYFNLMEYHRLNGHSNVPQFNEDGSKNEIGMFVNEQRILGTKGRLKYPSKERIFIYPIRKELLDDLGFEWNYEKNKHRRNFMKRIEEWQTIRDKHPDLVFPSKTYMRERQWRAEMKSRFKKLPEWKQAILLEERVV